jgi:spore coat polysaccharide biosynthesis predicted glycosyltransferase SpsG
MHITFILKASTKIGFGHLVRSRSLANAMFELLHPDDSLNFYLIGDKNLDSLLPDDKYNIKIFESEEEFRSDVDTKTLDGVVLFDLLSVQDELFDVTKLAKWRISISPIFSHLGKVDTFIHRTQYLPIQDSIEDVEIIKGLEYSIIQQGCRQIDAANFKRHLDEPRLSIAISMGGGDAANKTLKLIKKLNELKDDYTIWVMLGEGYRHSYDALIDESKNSHHEIILAKTNESMWRVLGLVSILIAPGGVTSYEAAYAGLPSLNIVENERQYALVRELFEEGVSLQLDGLEDARLITHIADLNGNRKKLFNMHIQSKGLIDGRAAERIYELIVNRRRKLHA